MSGEFPAFKCQICGGTSTVCATRTNGRFGGMVRWRKRRCLVTACRHEWYTGEVVVANELPASIEKRKKLSG